MTPEETIKASEARWGIGPEHWPGGQMLAAETVTLTTHSGTHVDAPRHYGPAAGGGKAMRSTRCRSRGATATASGSTCAGRAWAGDHAADVEAELDRLAYTLKPDDIVLVWTGTDLKQPGYETRHPGFAATQPSSWSTAGSA